MDDTDLVYLSQEVDYLGFLESKLRDLHGIATLVYELIQNADDVKDAAGNPGASEIVFDVCDDALVVTNDGVFRDEDFRRLQLVAGGAKRDEIGTTGAFGIGFISVYQITDYPELLSSGRHWIIHPDEPQNQRIHQRKAETNATLFRLPWAFNADSNVRQKLRLERISPESLDGFQRDMVAATTLAALFLKQVKKLEVKRNGQLVQRVVRADAEDDQLMIQIGEQVPIWRLFRGEFRAEEERLRAEHPQIEEKRRSQVVVAIPDEGFSNGRLFAVLPSETTIPLPFHINADFFPSSDRKHMLFSEDYQGEWNRAAIRAAARALAEGLEKLPSIMDAISLWKLIKSLDDCSRAVDAGQYDEVFKAFWQEAVPYLSELPLVYTATGSRVSPRMARLLESEAERNATAVLMDLGIDIVSPSLSSYFGLLRRREIGVPLLNAHDIVQALQANGFQEGLGLSKAPGKLRTIENWRLLWHALDAILKRTQQTYSEKETARLAVAKCPLVWDEARTLCAPQRLYRGDDETRKLFRKVRWLNQEIAAGGFPAELVPSFSVKAAIDFLEERNSTLEDDWHNRRLDLPTLYRWLEEHRQEILQNPSLLSAVRRLPIWPVAGHLRSLVGLYIPGGFEDPFKVSELVDIAALGGRHEFLKDLGVQELDFSRYAREIIPQVVREKPEVNTLQRRQAVQLLAQRLGEIQDDGDLARQLAGLPLIECTDREFHNAGSAYLPNPILKLLDQGCIFVAVLPGEHTEATAALYRWLGIAQGPRPTDLLARIRSLCSTSPGRDTREQITELFEYLVEQWPSWTIQEQGAFSALRNLAWLPGTQRGDEQWYRPNELYLVFQQYLFETQANFLDLPRRLQERAGTVKLNDFLGIQQIPSPGLVVAHLLQCSRNGQPVNREVYRFLNQKDNVGDPALQQLRNQPCLLLSDGAYVRPEQVFWGKHPFGRFRYQLGPDFRQYHDLLERLGVREWPSIQDHVQVLLEIGEGYGRLHKPLDDETYGVVLQCWETLSRAYEAGEIEQAGLAVLQDKPVIRNEEKILRPPEELYFEDRPGLKEKLPDLGSYVIKRPLGAWPAMEAAGVQPLGKAVRIHLVEPLDALPDERIAQRYAERATLIDRVIESDKASGVEGIEAEMLSQLSFSVTRALVVQYALQRQHHRPVLSEPEAIPARLLPEIGTLAVCYAEGRIPWPTIACEIAYAAKPAGEIGGLASGIKEALMYETYEEAERVLDELGYPRFESPYIVILPPHSVIPGFGGEELTKDAIAATSEQIEPVSAPQGDTGVSVPSPEATTPEMVIPPGPQAQPVTPEPPSATPPSPTGHPPHRPHTRSRSRIRTYVDPGEEARDVPEDPELQKRRTQTEKAGIQRVMRYEIAHDRNPEEMPPLNPGFDIRSVDRSGEVRFIEVKALSGVWEGPNPAQLTRREFEEAQDKRDEFWLYVVELATSDEARIYPIQNPAGWIQRYLFDDGWMGLAKEEEPEMVSDV